MTRELRPYQAEAVDAVRVEWAAGRWRTAVVLPTGCGKTDVIAKIATDEAAAGGRVLVLAHRGELLDQISARCSMYAPRIRVGRVQGGRDDYGYPITVAMQPTLKTASRRARLPRPTLVIVDECHHAASPTYRAILEWAGCYDPKRRVRAMGVSATLVRGDGKGLGSVWQSVAFERDIAWAVAEGHLVRPYGRVVAAAHLKLDQARKNAAGDDWSEGDLGRMVAQDVDQIVAGWLEHARKPDGSLRRTAAFMPTVESAEALRDAFDAAGVKAETVTGDTSPTERGDAAKATGIYGRLAAGTTTALCGVMVTTEGWDCPPVECILQGRPTKLPGLYAQIVGRGLRPSLATGKIDCLVLDVVGASRGQSLQTLIDLSPDSNYRPLPCEVCLGERGGIEDPGEVETLCRCRCTECGRYTARARRRFLPDECCECPSDVVRDPDGGRLNLRGQQISYETVDLLLASSPFRWLTTRKHEIPFLIVGDRLAAVWPYEGAYVAGHGPLKATGWTDAVRLGEPCSLDAARRLVEAWAIEVEPNYKAKAQRARGRTQPAGKALIKRAGQYGIRVERSMSTATVNELIDVALASSRLEHGR